MANPLYSELNSNNGMMDMISKFQKFRNTFSGDPKKQVYDLLNTGKMSKQQFDNFSNMAKQLSSIIK